MAIPLPSLDDLGYDDLVAQARALIPALQPDWTDHNPSDPGIAMVELLAWVSEMLVFQVNEIPDSHTRAFLSLLNGPEWTPPAPGEDLSDVIAATLIELDRPYRAVTTADYEHLTMAEWPQTPEAAALAGRFGAAAQVSRVRCLAQRNLTGPEPAARDEPAPGHVSLVVLPSAEPGAAEAIAALAIGLADFFEPRRILATHLHVTGPEYVDLQISADLALHDDAPPDATLAAVRDRLAEFLHPLTGFGGPGWPFGRDVLVPEVTAVLEQQPLVDYVEAVTITGPEPVVNDAGDAWGGSLSEHQLPRLAGVRLTGYDAYGRTHPLIWTAS